MPSIKNLQISHFRNIADAKLDFAPSLNLIAGENGSGKSSLLEAIHYAGLGRSFRNTRQTPIIMQGEESCTVFCALDNDSTLGISKSAGDTNKIKVNGESTASAAELARRLPLQLLNAEAFQLLDGGPKARRQFLDWGVFHVEHRFHDTWRDFRRCLQNRNVLLRKHADSAEITPWNQEFARLSTEIEAFRASYLADFLPFLKKTVAQLISLEDLEFSYYKGWKDDLTAFAALEQAQERDSVAGYTTTGPQRADLKIRLGSQYAEAVLSRGQQKLLVSAMKLAQGAYLAELSGNSCIFLIDDLPAELDRKNRQKLCALLHDLGSQIFITGTEENELIDTLHNSGFAISESKLFHVKHGRMEALEGALERAM